MERGIGTLMHPGPEELLTFHLRHLRLDVYDGVLNARNDDVLEGIHTPIGDFDDLVQRCKGSLQAISRGSED